MNDEILKIENENSGTPEATVIDGTIPAAALEPKPVKPKKPKKLRSDSTWSGLTPAQWQKMETWLFEENASYKDVQARVLRDFGIACSVCNVRAFYWLARAGDCQAELLPLVAAARNVNGSGKDLATLRATAFTLLGKKLVERVLNGDDPNQLTPLARLLLESQDRETEDRRVTLERDRFEFKAVKAAMQASPLFEELTELNAEDEDYRTLRIRYSLFGDAALTPETRAKLAENGHL